MARNAVAGSGVLLLERGQVLHQAALAPGGVVLVDDALLGGPIQGADGFEGCLARFFRVAGRDRLAGVFHEGAGAPAVHPVVQAALFILSVALDSGLDIGQLYSSESVFPVNGALLYWIAPLLSSHSDKKRIFRHLTSVSKASMINFHRLAGWPRPG